jgi:hypothetical protein
MGDHLATDPNAFQEPHEVDDITRGPQLLSTSQRDLMKMFTTHRTLSLTFLKLHASLS